MTPLSSTDVGWVSEMMQDGVTGLLVPSHDQGALTVALEKLIASPVLRKQMGVAGRQRLRDKGMFSLEGMVRCTESCYARWLDERRS